MYDKSLGLFIFRRDFRLYDNKGLIEALKNNDYVLPIFIMTPVQLTKNKYKSDNCVQFMFESLLDLEEQLAEKGGKLYYFYGEPDKIIGKLIKETRTTKVYVNMDYTGYSIKRDKKIENICKKNGVEFVSIEDLPLNPIGSIKTGDDIYLKFTPYFNKAKKIKVNEPMRNNYKNYYTKSVSNEYKGDFKRFFQINDEIWQHGGRNNALKILGNVDEFKNYNKMRNMLNYPTTNLSAYIKFGCVSIREVYWSFKNKLGMGNDLIKQLYWRDFYMNIIWRYPDSLDTSLKENYRKIKWENDVKYFNAWKKGETGFPIVDACMRQLNQTGYMHNRGRLIVSNFLIKILLNDWDKGAKYFAERLYDYDPSANSGNWQWGASTGADSQPYFRIFNPWLQSKKFDPNGEFIKKYVPELDDVDAKDLHKWDLVCEKYLKNGVKYFEPIVDYEKQRKDAKKMYAKIF